MRTFLVLFLLLSNAWAVDQSLLCGDLPKDQAAAREAALVVEQAMPPVSDQNPTSWCYAYAGADLVNYHYHKSLGLESYGPANMVSPLELVSAYNDYRNVHCSSEAALIDNMDLDVGGSSFTSFLGIQDREYKLRSLEQIPADSLNEDNPRAQEIVKKLVEEYGGDDCVDCYSIAGVLCPISLYETDEFQAQVYGFEMLNEWIYKVAEYNDLLSSPFQVQNYNGIAALKGEEDITLPPFSTNVYKGNDADMFLKDIGHALHDDNVPVSVAVCTNDFDLESIDIHNDECGGHEMVLTSAFYQDGKCVVRLKNSWGTGWGEDGYLTISMDHFLKTIEHRRMSAGQIDRYRATWITPRHEEINQIYHKDQCIYKGELVYQRQEDNSYTYLRRGGFDYDRQGKLTEAYNQPWQGRFYSGEVKDYGSGQWEPTKGLLKNEDDMVTDAYSWELNNGIIYTGSVNSKSDGSWSTITGIGRDKESGKAVFAYLYPMEDGISYHGSITEAEDGSFIRESGVDYRDGKLVYIYKYELSTGEIYTGAVRDNNDGSFNLIRGSE